MHSPEIKQLIEDMLRAMNVSFESVVFEEGNEKDLASFLIKTNDSGALIGTHGAHLSAFNHVIKRIAAKRFGEEGARFFVDVNSYQEKSIEELKTKIKIFADRAKSFGVNVELPPMSAYERMLVHSFLSGDPELKTESEGEGKNRRVIIKYIRPGSF